MSDDRSTRPRRIFLHPGFHATGCDVIRRFLWDNRAVLAPHLSWLMPRQLEEVVARCESWARTDNPMVLAELVETMDQALALRPPAPGTDLIVSAEGLSGSVPGRRGVVDYGAAPVIASFLTGYLAERFAGAECHVILTTREPADWRRAVWAEQPAQERQAWPVAERALMPVDLEAEAAEIAAALAPLPVYVLRLEEARTHPLGPGGAFLELAELPAQVWQGLSVRG